MPERDKARSAIAERLRIARETAGLTQAQVAKKLSLHRPSVSEMEAGRRSVTADELSVLADLYGVSADWLLNEGGDDPIEARVQLAARELARLKPQHLNRLFKLLASMKDDNE